MSKAPVSSARNAGRSCTKEKMNNAIYEKRIVAFVDILGFSTMIEDSKADTPLRRKIKRAMEIIRRAADSEYEDKKVSTFSDSAVISYRLQSRSSLFYLLMDVIHLQLELGTLGIMIRGGIAIGDCFHDGKIIFGPAMNEAYRLESKVAQWPRVVITSATLKVGISASVDTKAYALKYDLKDIMGCLKQDDYDEEVNDPDLYFVDFLRQPQELTDFGDEYFEWLRGFRVAIIEGLNRYGPKSEDELEMGRADADKVFKKYRWILNYWNSVVGDDNAALPVPDIDPEYQKAFREQYKKLKIRKRYPYY